MTRQLALLTHVYNAAWAVEQHLAVWRSLPPEVQAQLELLVVDDGSTPPLQCDRTGVPLRQLRITTDIPWNMAGAKNLLAQQSSAPWMLFFDIDNLLPADELTRLVLNLGSLHADKLYMFRRSMGGQQVDPHINTFLVHRDVLNAVGGFDEDFCGHYGYEDVFFQNLLARRGVERILLNDLCFLQGTARTETLDRDMARNQALIETKVNSGQGTSPRQLRFEWVEC